MSAFIVDHETIDKAVFLFNEDRLAAQDLDKLGNDLWRLNAEAVAIRYREPVTEPGEYRWKGRAFSKVVAFKGLQCLLYQCSEGEIPQTSELYRRCNEKLNATAREIVEVLPEYEKAKWG